MIHMLRWQHQLALGPPSLLKLFPCLQIMKNDGCRTAIVILCENKAWVKHICHREAIGVFCSQSAKFSYSLQNLFRFIQFQYGHLFIFCLLGKTARQKSACRIKNTSTFSPQDIFVFSCTPPSSIGRLTYLVIPDQKAISGNLSTTPSNNLLK